MYLVKALWVYRTFILGSVKREFQTKYQNSMLGALWNFLNPLAMIVVYTVIFSQVMQAKLPGVDNSFGYSIYLCAGLLTWGLFAEIITRSQTIFLENSNLLKKINFPKVCLPVIVILNALLNFAIVFSLFTLFLILSDSYPGWAFLALLPLLLIVVIFAVGLGIIIGVLNIFFRDVGHFFGIFISFWFWLTPIIYPISILPEFGRELMGYNPMAPLFGAVQTTLVQGLWPNWFDLIYPAILGSIFCLLGWRLFRKRAGEIVDEL
jgi:lipopolysaccharide transport system permease protein